MPRKQNPWTTKKLALTIARLADDKQAGNIVVLDVAQAIQVADFFVVCDGQNRRHMGTIAESVAKELKKDGFYRIGGSPAGDDNWVLLDFGPVVLHVFSKTARGYYDLENLWGDCTRVRWKTVARKKKAAEEETGLTPSTGAFSGPDDLPGAGDQASATA